MLIVLENMVLILEILGTQQDGLIMMIFNEPWHWTMTWPKKSSA